MSARGLLAGLLLSGLAVPVLGQALSHDANAPVDVDADHVDVQDKAGRFVWDGHVIVHQANLVMTAPRLNGSYHRVKANVQLDELNAQGGVTFTLENDNAHGDVAIYDLNRKIITLIGGVVLNQSGNTIRGGRLIYDVAGRHAIMDGHGPAGPNQTVGGRNQSGRVTGHFVVPQRTQ